jgi:hypothetical protein
MFQQGAWLHQLAFRWNKYAELISHTTVRSFAVSFLFPSDFLPPK